MHKLSNWFFLLAVTLVLHEGLLWGNDQPACSSCTGVMMDTLSGSGAKQKLGYLANLCGDPPACGAVPVYHTFISTYSGYCTDTNANSPATFSELITNAVDPDTGVITGTTNVSQSPSDPDLYEAVWDDLDPTNSLETNTCVANLATWSQLAEAADGYSTQYSTTQYANLYATSDLKSKVMAQVTASMTAWATNAQAAGGGASLDITETNASMSETKYHLRLLTQKDTLYIVTWPIQVATTTTICYTNGDGSLGTTNITTNTFEMQDWTVTGTGGQVTSDDYTLASSFPSAGVSVQKSMNIGQVCVQAIPLGGGSGGGGGGGGGGSGGGPGNGGGCTSCGGTSQTPAGSFMATPALVSPLSMGVSLGSDPSGFSIGSVGINPSGPMQATPAALQILGFTNNLTNVSSGGVLQQILAPQALFNILSNSSSQFDVQVFDTNNFSTTPIGGLYPPTTNTQFVTWRFENPGGPTDINDLRIIENRGGTSTTNLYTWSSGNAVLTRISGNGLRQDVWTTSWSSDLTLCTNTHEIDYTNNTQVFMQTNIYEVFSWGEALVSTTDGTGSAARTTTYSYTGTGQKSEVQYPDGYYESYTYDSVTNRLIEKDWANHSTLYGYAAVGGGDDGSYEPDRPRAVTNLYGSTVISIHYSVLTSSNQIEIDAATSSSAWNDTANLYTTNIYDANGRLNWVTRPDKTMQWYDYVIGPTSRTNIVSTGYAASSGALITNIVTTTILGLNGSVLSTTTVENSIVTDQAAYTNYDTLGRVGQINYLDKTYIQYQYDCCGISLMTNRDGLETTYTYDGLKRMSSKTENQVSGSIIWSYNYDPKGNILSTVRQGTDSSIITNSSASFDNAGHQVTAVDALSNTNFYSEGFDGSYFTQTNIHPDGGTSLMKYGQDRLPVKVTGTAVRPVGYSYGADGGGSYVTETKLDASGSPTSESKQSYTDLLGRRYKIIYASGSGTPTAMTYYNGLGQLTNRTDPDSDVIFYGYNAKGEQCYTIIDVNQNGTIDWSGPDRITFTTNDVTTDNGANVRRTRTYVWSTSSNTSNLLSTAESSVEGLTNWSIIWNNGVGVTNQSATIYGSSGYRYVTSTGPDGSYSVSTYQYGQLLSVATTNATGTQLSKITYDYDAHGRRYVSTDARNGTTTYYFNNADRVNGIKTPSPDGVLSGQVTTNYFDNMVRVWKVTQPDGTSVTNEFYLTGDLKRSYGSRTYPVGYGYDPQGRMTAMTNWTSFATSAGARVTTWTYDAYRGFLSSKTYDGNTTGPIYGYTSAGRLQTRLWARGTNTTYSYDGAGNLSTVTYNDSTTAGITNGYDRRSRLTIVSNGPTVCNLTYNDQNQLLSESYTGGPLGGVSITNGYDSLLRRTNNVTLHSGTVLTVATNNFDAASRLNMISDGTNSAAYTYLANSPLISQITFAQSGTTRMMTAKSYDYLNRLISISSTNASSVVLDSHGYSYNTANQRTAATNVDNSMWNYQYDTLGQVTSGKKFWNDGTVVAGEQFGYTFDDIGNRITTQAGGSEFGANLRYANYTVNNLNQYTSRTVPDAVDLIGTATNTSTVTVNLQPSYRKSSFYRTQLALTNTASAAWQPVTNLAVLNVGTNSVTIASNVGNIFLPQTPESFMYDADGNLTQDGRWTYTWDAENRLIDMTSLSGGPVGSKLELDFTYDYKGRRIQKMVSTNNGSSYVPQYTNSFAYDGWNLVTELNNANSAVIRSYMWGTDLSGSSQSAGGVGGLLKVASNGTNCFVNCDGNGNVAALVNTSDGTVLAQYEYTPFGEIIRITGPLAKNNPFRFSNKYQDDETDRLYFGYRYLNPSLGQWINRDPINELSFVYMLLKDKSALTPKRERLTYTYCNNNPVCQWDYLGLDATNAYVIDNICPGTYNGMNRNGLGTAGDGTYICYYSGCGISGTFDQFVPSSSLPSVKDVWVGGNTPQSGKCVTRVCQSGVTQVISVCAGCFKQEVYYTGYGTLISAGKLYGTGGVQRIDSQTPDQKCVDLDNGKSYFECNAQLNLSL